MQRLKYLYGLMLEIVRVSPKLVHIINIHFEYQSFEEQQAAQKDRPSDLDILGVKPGAYGLHCVLQYLHVGISS